MLTPHIQSVKTPFQPITSKIAIEDSGQIAMPYGGLKQLKEALSRMPSSRGRSWHRTKPPIRDGGGSAIGMASAIAFLGAVLNWPLHAGPSPLEVVAAVLCAEARGEGRIGMSAVLEVIDHRAARMGVSRTHVITQPKQFACLFGKRPADLIANMQRERESTIALRLAASEPIRSNLTRGATHYHRSGTTPYWASGQTPVAVIGRHVFYRLP